MAVTEEPIISRLDRLDNMLRQLEEIRGSNRSPKSSGVSTPSTGTPASEGQIDLSPKSLEKHCRPIHRVMMDTEIKGSLIERLDQAEERVLKLGLQLEEELEAEKRREEESDMKEHKKGLKSLVKKMVKGSSGRHKIKE